MQSYIWLEETKELFVQNNEYEELFTQLESLGINEVEEDLMKYQSLDAAKFNHKEFYKTHNKRLSSILECIVLKKFSHENAVKMAVLERLISKGRELNFRENQTQMVFFF